MRSINYTPRTYGGLRLRLIRPTEASNPNRNQAMNAPEPTGFAWDTQAKNRARRLERAASLARGRIVAQEDIVALLEAVIEPGDRLCIEDNNQKQADFLARALVQTDPAKVRELHLVQSLLALPEHVDIIERGQVSRIDFSFSGPQAGRLARLVESGKIAIGAIHTYLELFSRYFVDLTPHVALVAAQAADRQGNLYTGPNTEDTPAIVEATAFKGGIVIAQVNEFVDKLPRVDIPADWVDFTVQAPTPHYVEPLFTRDPALITETQGLTAMIAIKGLYAEYGITPLNHGIGFDTAAIELLLPTYAAELGLKGKICTHWALNPHPTLIPAIEAGFVQSVHAFGSEVGMERYVAARPDVFFIGANGNISTATKGRIAGFGGAPNMGADARGRRHASPAWLKAGREGRGNNPMPRGQKLVAQIVETFREHMEPAFVERLDAWDLAESAGLDLPPVMIYGEDLTHIITEEGIANLLRCASPEEREQAIRGVAGYTPVGMGRDRRAVENLRDRGIIRRPEDLGIDPRLATRDLLAARNIKDLVHASGGLYDPPKKFRNW